MKERKPQLHLPTSKWKKVDWIAAAKIISNMDDEALKIKGLISRAMYLEFVEEIAERVSVHGTSRKSGPKARTKYTPEYIRGMKLELEPIRKKLEKEYGTKNMSNADVARKFAYSEASSEFRKKTGLTKGQTATRIEREINYMNQIEKNEK